MKGNSADTGVAMPKYRCHKEVWALKIGAIHSVPDGTAMIDPEDENYAAFAVSGEYMLKHSPRVGGYFVLYEDGYQSFSPPLAFEDGYTRI